MKDLLKGYRGFPAVTVVLIGLIACLSNLSEDANELPKADFADFAVLSGSSFQNFKPMRFVVKPVGETGEGERLVDDEEVFEAPVRLKVGDQFLNDAARQMYPSPAMFDIDRDGQLELVVGDIFGSLNVYENLSGEKSDPVWSTHIPLKLSDGEKVKVSNW